MPHVAPLINVIYCNNTCYSNVVTNFILLSLFLSYFILCLSYLLLSLLACMLAMSNPRTRRRCTPVPAQGGANRKKTCTMRTLTSMRTCPRPSRPLAILPSLPLLLIPLPPPLPVATKPLFLKSLPSSSLLILKLKTLLR